MKAFELRGSERLTAARWATILLALLVACVAEQTGAAQVYQRIPTAPPAMLPPSPGVVVETHLDPFGIPEQDNLLLRPWHTLNLPLGTWGNQFGWDDSSMHSTTIRRNRQAMVQSVALTGGYVARDSDDSFGYSFASSAITLVAPLGHEDRLLVAVPRFRTDWVDGPIAVDMPSRLYSASVDFGFRWKVSPGWALICGVQPGWYNDDQSDSSGQRLGALLLISHEVVPEILTLSAGVARLDRNDVNIIPTVGATWTPNPETRFDLVFPRPKISRRIGHVPYMQEDWAYIGASFGGGTWAVRRSSGMDDELTSRDFRLSVGVERILDGGSGFNAEVGYVFNRNIEYSSDEIQVDFGNSFIIETGIRF